MPDLTKLRYETDKKTDAAKASNISNEAEIDRGFWKTLALGILGTFFAFSFSLLLREYFFDAKIFDLTSTQYTMFIATAAGLYTVVYFLQIMLIKGFGRLNGLLTFNVIGMIGAYYDQLGQEIFIGALLVYAILLYGAYLGWHELRIMLRVKFFRIAHRVIPKAMTALALLISLVFFLNLDQGRTNVFNQGMIDSLVFRPTEAVVARVFPFFSFEKSGDEVLTALATDRVERASGEITIPEYLKIEVVEKATTKMKEQVGGFVKAEIDFGKKVGEVIYEMLIDQLIENDGKSKLVIIATLTALMFLILKTVGIIFAFAISIVSFVVFEVLVAMDFATVVLESRTREMIIMK